MADQAGLNSEIINNYPDASHEMIPPNIPDSSPKPNMSQPGLSIFKVLLIFILFCLVSGIIFFTGKYFLNNISEDQQTAKEAGNINPSRFPIAITPQSTLPAVSYQISQDISAWKQYQDINQQFSFKYPDNLPDFKTKLRFWGYYYQFPTMVTEILEAGRPVANVVYGIEIEGPYPNSKNINMETYLKEKGKYLPKEGINQGEMGHTERRSVLLDNRSAILVKETFGEEEYPTMYHLYFQTDFGIYSMLLLHLSSLTQEKGTSTFDNIIASLKLSPPKTGNSLNDGWIWMPAYNCGVRFPAPDNLNNKYLAEEGIMEREYPNIFKYRIYLSITKNQNSDLVEVSCSPNLKKLSPEGFLIDIKQRLAALQLPVSATCPTSIKESESRDDLWGRHVRRIVYNVESPAEYGGDNYILTTDKYIYSVRLVDSKSDPAISDRLKYIFEHLQFE